MAKENVTARTVFKLLNVPVGGRISREHYDAYGRLEQDKVKKMNPVEAEKVYNALMVISDALGLDKFARDGGMSYTISEWEVARHVSSRTELPGANKAFHTALFKAIDTSGDGYLQRDEWSTYLKVCGTYVSESQARQSFDSIDTNKDGQISLEEYVAVGIDFWCNLGKDLGSQNLYGTEKLLSNDE